MPVKYGLSCPATTLVMASSRSATPRATSPAATSRTPSIWVAIAERSGSPSRRPSSAASPASSRARGTSPLNRATVASTISRSPCPTPSGVSAARSLRLHEPPGADSGIAPHEVLDAEAAGHPHRMLRVARRCGTGVGALPGGDRFARLREPPRGVGELLVLARRQFRGISHPEDVVRLRPRRRTGCHVVSVDAGGGFWQRVPSVIRVRAMPSLSCAPSVHVRGVHADRRYSSDDVPTFVLPLETCSSRWRRKRP